MEHRWMEHQRLNQSQIFFYQYFILKFLSLRNYDIKNIVSYVRMITLIAEDANINRLRKGEQSCYISNIDILSFNDIIPHTTNHLQTTIVI